MHHELLTEHIPKNIDVMIHSGDATNVYNPLSNFQEMKSFIDWYSRIQIKNKIYIAGNHDTSVERKMITHQDFKDAGIIYLQLEEVIIDGIKFFGSPYTPTYGDWAFMKKRGKLHDVYTNIPDDTDVLISHGPPKSMLDLSYDRGNNIEMCGCKELWNHIYYRPNIKYVLYGHIHSFKDIINTGVRVVNGVTYSNASVVNDGKFGMLTSYGNILEINK